MRMRTVNINHAAWVDLQERRNPKPDPTFKRYDVAVTDEEWKWLKPYLIEQERNRIEGTYGTKCNCSYQERADHEQLKADLFEAAIGNLPE